MKTKVISFILFITIVHLFCGERSTPLIINHTCEDLSQIPISWIDSAQAKQKWHYAHTSHGGQLTTGLQRIEDDNSDYNIARASSSLPTETDALCIFDGQENDTYITPEEYWRTKEGMDWTRDVLNHNPSINVSQWSWCTQLNSYSEANVQAYIDSISVLEAEFPDVTFVYMTCNAQGTGSSGYNRYLRNEQIRQFCRDNNKVLYDFGDLDAWWYNSSTEQWEQNTYEYEGHTVPVEHSQFNGNESGHTTHESCEQKGRAVWWMMAKLAGWDESTSVIEESSESPEKFKLNQNYPNPFNPTTAISYQISEVSNVELAVYNVLGQEVAALVYEKQDAGKYSVTFNAAGLVSSVYFYKLIAGDFTQVRKMILMR